MSTYIHIGYPKTATSWFKDFLYPKIKNANIIYNDNLDFDIHESKKGIKIIGDFPEKEHRIIVSHKFSGLVDFQWDNGKYRSYFAPQLKKSFPDAKIILFIRNQEHFLASAYSSYITHGGTYTFRKLYKNGDLTNGKMFSYEYLDYTLIIDQYIKFFGEENVFIYLYEEFQANRKEFLEKYIDQLHFEVDLDYINYKKYNQKLRKGFAGLYRFANKFSRKGVQPKKCILNMPFLFFWLNKRSSIKINNYIIWGKYLDNKKVLGEELINEINEYYKEPNNKLINYKGCESIRKYGYPL